MSIETAEQFEENGQYEEAYAEYKKSYSHNPNDLSLLAQLGHISTILNKKNEAEEYYNKMLTLDATNPTAYEQLMDIYIDTDKFKYYVCRGNYHIVQQQIEHASHDFQKAINQAGGEPAQVAPVRFTLGTLYEEMGNPNKAIDEYLKVLDYEDFVNSETYVRLANLYDKEDALGSAIETLERAIKSGFDDAAIRETLAKFYFKDNAPEKAKEVCSSGLTKIKAMLAIGELDEAKKALDSIDDNMKEDPLVYALKAEYYYTSKDYEKALDAVEKYAQKVPNHPLIFQMRALIYEAQNSEYMATLNWAKYHLVRGNRDVAINEFMNAYQLKNDDTDMIATLANLLEATGEVHHSMELYERLVQLEPNNRSALEKLSRYWESNGDNRLAIQYMEKVLDADKRNFSAMKKLAELYIQNRENGAAIDMYKKYLQTAPQNDEYTEVQQKLNRLEKSEPAPGEESASILDKIVDFFVKK